MLRMSLLLLATIVSAMVLPPLASAEDATALISQKLVPKVLKNPGHPYQAKKLKDLAKARISLKKKSRKGNGITDDDKWFVDNVLPRPGGPKDDQWRHVPGETRWGDLKFFRSTEELHVGIYEASKKRTGAPEEKGFSSVYDKEYNYTAVLFNADFAPQKLYVLEAFHPGILEMNDAHVAGNILYFDCNYNGYANIVKERTGYLVALDLEGDQVLWTSGNLISSYRGFVLYKGAVISGYGFTEEKDSLFVLNRFTGKRWLKTSLNSAPEYIIPMDGKLYVRTYHTDYLFEIIEK
jgi:hypothetical protein